MKLFHFKLFNASVLQKSHSDSYTGLWFRTNMELMYHLSVLSVYHWSYVNYAHEAN